MHNIACGASCDQCWWLSIINEGEKQQTDAGEDHEDLGGSIHQSASISMVIAAAATRFYRSLSFNTKMKSILAFLSLVVLALLQGSTANG